MMDDVSRTIKSRPSRAPSSSGMLSRPLAIRSSAPRQKVFPTTAASTRSERSCAGSASSRAATIPLIVVGSDSEPASAIVAASCSMKSGLPSAVSASREASSWRTPPSRSAASSFDSVALSGESGSAV